MAIINHFTGITFCGQWEVKVDDVTTRVYRYFKARDRDTLVWRHDGTQMEYCFAGLDVWYRSSLTPEHKDFSEITVQEANLLIFGTAKATEKFRPAPTPDDDEILIVDANGGFKRKIEFTDPAPPPTGDPVTEAFYRDRLAAAMRCKFGEPNPKDADNQKAMARKVDLEECRRNQLINMAAVEKEAGYSWFEEDEYKRLTGYTERRRK